MTNESDKDCLDQMENARQLRLLVRELEQCDEGSLIEEFVDHFCEEGAGRDVKQYAEGWFECMGFVGDIEPKVVPNLVTKAVEAYHALCASLERNDD